MDHEIAKEIRQDVKELLQRSAVHNELLKTHEARSLALQKSQDLLAVRLQPVEDHVSLVNRIAKVATSIAVGVVVLLIGNVLLKAILAHIHL